MSGISNRKILLVLLKTIVFIACLFPFLVVYLPDIIGKYQTEDTTFALKKIPNNNRTIPAITLCSLKPYKLETIKKATGSYNREAFSLNVTFSSNISVPSLFREASFLLNRDFFIFFGIGSKMLKIGRNEMRGFIINVDEVPTRMKGMCYSLFFERSLGGYMGFKIIPDTTQEYSPEGTIFHVSTKSTISTLSLPVGKVERSIKPLVVAKKFAFRYKMIVDLEETVWQFHKGNPNCPEGCSLEHCYNNHHLTEELDCMPIVRKALFPSSTLVLCLTPEENSKMVAKIDNKTYAINCPLPASDVEFSAIVTDDEFLAMPDPKDVIIAQFRQSSTLKTLKKEVLIYDTASLIGSLGGFLGLFIGFSFFGVVSLIIDKLDWLCQK